MLTMAGPQVSYRFIATARPGPTLERDHQRCGRCGRVRHVNPTRKGSGYCGDCIHFAIADGWTDVRPGRPKQPTQPTQEEN